jgi:hypothetical protein
MSLSNLAVVELQLIMHCLDKSSVLQLARCSRFTLSCASTPFAFQTLSPVFFEVHELDANLGLQLGASLLRHCQIQLRWLRPAVNYTQPPLTELELSSIEAIPNLVSLDVSTVNIRLHEFISLLQRAARPRGLRSLRFYELMEADEQVGALLLQHHAHIEEMWIYPNCRRMVPSVALLPHLTQLTLENVFDSGDDFLQIMHCKHLRSLSLIKVFESLLHPILTSLSMQSLENLTLSTIYANHALGWNCGPQPIGFESIFENLSSLTSLELQLIWGIDVVLTALFSSRSLRRLQIHLTGLTLQGLSEDDLPRVQYGSTMPSMEVLDQLMVSVPTLMQLRLCILSKEEYSKSRWSGDPAAEWTAGHEKLVAFAQRFPARVLVLLDAAR